MKKKLFAALATVVMSACIGCKAEIPPYLIVDGTAVVGHTDELPAKLVIPNSITEIGESAFSGCESLTSVVIPDSVEVIDESAFWGCKSLTRVTIGNGVETIGAEAFSGCFNLAEVTYNGTLAQWCQIDNDDHLVGNAKIIKLSDVENLKALTTLRIPDSVTEIGLAAFTACKSLASVVIPDSVTKISAYAFQDCDSLASVVIPDSVTEIGNFAFYKMQQSQCSTLYRHKGTVGENKNRN